MSSNTPARTSNPDLPVTVTVRWPWTGEEKFLIAASVVVPFVLMVATHLAVWWPIPVGLVLAFLLFRTGKNRKDTSAVQATITATRVTVKSRGLLGDSSVDRASVRSIATRDYGSDQTFLLSGGGTTARVPLRLVNQHPVVAMVVADAAERAAVSADARDLLAQTPIITPA